MADEEIVRRLETVIAVLLLAHRDELERTRASIRADRVQAAVLDGARTWTGAARLQDSVVKRTHASTRTIQARIADLLAQRVLEKRGGGRAVEYKATGII